MNPAREIRRTRIAWRPSYRIVPSRFPPVGLFDRIASPADLDALFELEGMTNPRLRQEIGDLSMVPPGRRITGPGTTPVMAAFLHANPSGSRFSDGRWGVYYAARERDTAIAETIHHRQAFLRYTREPACVLQMRCYLADVAVNGANENNTLTMTGTFAAGGQNIPIELVGTITGNDMTGQLKTSFGDLDFKARRTGGRS